MEKVSKILSVQLSRIAELVSRIEEKGGEMALIEGDMLLAALRDMYETVYVGMRESRQLPDIKEEAAEVHPAAAPAAEPKAESKPSPLLVDSETEAVYAEEEPQSDATEAAEQPTMEEIEGKMNDTLFEEPEPEPELEPEPETEAEPEPEPEPEPELEPEPKPEQEKPRLQDLLKGQAALSKPEPVVKEEPVAKPSQPSLFEYLKKGDSEEPSTRTIADNLGQQSKGGIENKINANKVADLRTVININDKFSFMNELFHNNMKGYNDFIIRLNATDSREEALAYVAAVAQQYSWDDESQVVRNFYKIFDRKF